MDLTPFFQNVERIAGALERIADALTKPVISVGSPFQAPVALYTAREEEEIPEWPDGADEVIERLSARASVPILAAAAELAGPAPEIAPPAPQDEPGAPPPAAHEERTPEPPAPATDDPVEAAVLRLHSTGTTTYSGIAKALNAQGLLSHMGTPFHPPGVKKLMARLGLDSPHSYVAVGYRRRTAAEIAADTAPITTIEGAAAAETFKRANAREIEKADQKRLSDIERLRVKRREAGMVPQKDRTRTRDIVRLSELLDVSARTIRRWEETGQFDVMIQSKAQGLAPSVAEEVGNLILDLTRPSGDGQKTPRTFQGVVAGLSSASEAPKVDVTEAVITGGPPQDHLDTTRHLSPRTRTRYELHKQHKKGGGKALSQMELDQMEAQFLARGGKVTKLPACTDSDGFDHLKAQR